MTDIVTHLRMWGLKVETAPGYATRGRPYTFKPRGVLCHHTASGSTSGNFGSNNIVTSGRSDLPGPLCQFLLGRDGTVRVIALGYANHAGTGGPYAGIPANTGNSYLYGIEAENNGVGERWGEAQLNAYYRLCAALLAYMGTKDTSKVFGHKEWTSRKIDPAGITMPVFRSRVGEALAAGPSVKTIKVERLKPGKMNNDVLALKKRMIKKGLYEVPVNKKTGERPKPNRYFGKHLQKAYSEYQKSLGFTGSDANGLPGKTSLRKIGLLPV